MLWGKKKEPESLRFQHYVPIRLSENLPNIFRKKAKENYFPEVYKNCMQLLQSETFIMACMIGTIRPDIINGIYRQNGEDYQQLIEITRDGLNKMIAIGEKREELDLNALASSLKKPELDILPKGDPDKRLSTEIINSLGIPFLFGYTFGHDHPNLFLEILEKRLQEANPTGPNTLFIVGLLSIYSPLIEEDDLSFLSNSIRIDNIQTAYEKEALIQKLVSIYQNIASELIDKYELVTGTLK